MVFGLNDKQIMILAYLYDLRNTPETPPDPRLRIDLIAQHLKMKQQEVKKEIRGLIKRMFIKYITFERHGYCKILPRGIHEIEKRVKKTTEWEISTEKVGMEHSKTEG